MSCRVFFEQCFSVLLLLCGAGCGYHPTNLPELAAQGTVIRVACLGDSLTVTGGSNCYPVRLAQSLGPRWDVRNFAVSPGATALSIGDTPYLKSSQYREVLRWAPHAVLILLGTNDSKPRHWYYKKEFAEDYRRLVRELKGLPSRPNIWVVFPPPAFHGQWGVRDSVIREEVIPLLRKIARKEGVFTLDMYSVFEGHSEMFPDQIHPDDRGVALMADAFYQCLSGMGVR